MLLEQAPEVGGKLGRHVRAGYLFDTGPSLLTMPEVFEDFFADTGDPLDRVLPLRRVDPLTCYRWPDGTVLDLPADGSATGPALDAALGPGAGAQWLRLLDRGARIEAAARQPFLEAPFAGPTSLARLAVRRPGDIRVISPAATLRGLGRRMLNDERLQMLLDRYATFSGSDPRRAPAALAMIPWVEQASGAWYIPGGLHRLGLALRDRATEHGVEIHCGSPVASIETAGGRATGVSHGQWGAAQCRRRRGDDRRRRRLPQHARRPPDRPPVPTGRPGPLNVGIRPAARAAGTHPRARPPHCLLLARLRRGVRRGLRRAAGRGPHDLRQQAGRPLARPDTRRGSRGSSSSTPPRTGRDPARSTGRRLGWPLATATSSSTGSRSMGSTSGTGW